MADDPRLKKLRLHPSSNATVQLQALQDAHNQLVDVLREGVLPPSPDGTLFRLAVRNDGTLYTIPV